MLTQKKLEYFRELLNEKLGELLHEANKTVTGMTTQEETYADPTDRAALESDRNFTLRIRDRERRLIVKIKEALERIETGSYGICELCGEEITEARLKARPVTTHCIDCKTRQEMEEKVKGI
jgi:DnaK suppressor protein